MTHSDRRRELGARVYGRHPDPAAVAELRALLGPDEATPDPIPRPARRTPRPVVIGAAVLAAVLVGAAAWGIGAVGGRPTVIAHATPTASTASTDPITVFTSSASGTTTIVDAATGRVLTQTGPLPSCAPKALEHPTDPRCRVAAEFQQAGVARARQAAATASGSAQGSAPR